MKIITSSCPKCSTVVAANELEEKRVMKCPGLGCSAVLRFEDLPTSDREYFLNNKEKYQI